MPVNVSNYLGFIENDISLVGTLTGAALIQIMPMLNTSELQYSVDMGALIRRVKELNSMDAIATELCLEY